VAFKEEIEPLDALGVIESGSTMSKTVTDDLRSLRIKGMEAEGEISGEFGCFGDAGGEGSICDDA